MGRCGHRQRIVLSLLGTLGCVTPDGGDGASGGDPASADPLSRAHAAVVAAPAISTTAGGMEIHGIYKLQMPIEHESRHLSRDSVVTLLVDAVFEPYETFWSGYIGDVEAFTTWARDDPLTADTMRLLTPWVSTSRPN